MPEIAEKQKLNQPEKSAQQTRIEKAEGTQLNAAIAALTKAEQSNPHTAMEQLASGEIRRTAEEGETKSPDGESHDGKEQVTKTFRVGGKTYEFKGEKGFIDTLDALVAGAAQNGEKRSIEDLVGQAAMLYNKNEPTDNSVIVTQQTATEGRRLPDVLRGLLKGRKKEGYKNPGKRTYHVGGKRCEFTGENDFLTVLDRHVAENPNLSIDQIVGKATLEYSGGGPSAPGEAVEQHSESTPVSVENIPAFDASSTQENVT